MTRLEALIALKGAVEAGRYADHLHAPAFPSESAYGPCTWHASVRAAHGCTDAAITLIKSVLPGWGWRMAQCSVSDDAWVFPDFNCPVHAARLRETVPVLIDGQEWVEFTDIDQRPAGNPARALLLSGLTALIALERIKQERANDPS